jgi:glyoxylase-like metal-dependent hydrolase (beta-lactamase superfamily II)
LLWPEKKALFISDADWIGNPVFLASSLRDCISSLATMKVLTEAGEVKLLLPGHGQVKQGGEEVLSHLDYHIRRLKAIRWEVLAAYRSHGEEKEVHELTRILTQMSPLFRMLKLINYPRMVVFVHTVSMDTIEGKGYFCLDKGPFIYKVLGINCFLA